MPIRRNHLWFSPIHRRDLSAIIRFRRTGGQREGCGRPHGREVLRFSDGLWWDEGAGTWRCGQSKWLRRMPPPHSTILPMRRTRVVLSTCHIDHDPTNNAPDNRAALSCPARQGGAHRAAAADVSGVPGAWGSV